MNKLLRVLTYVFCLAQLGFVISRIPGIHRAADIYTAILLFALPVLAIAALVTGPDSEERNLQKQVAKARLKHELEELTNSKKD